MTEEKLTDLFKYLIETGYSQIKGDRYFQFQFKGKPLQVSINVNYGCDCKDCSINNHKWRCMYVRAVLRWLSLTQSERNGYKPIKSLLK